MNRAKMRGTAANFYSFDYSAVVFTAFFASHLIGVMHFLISALFTEGVAIINVRATAEMNGLFENGSDGLVNFFNFFIF